MSSFPREPQSVLVKMLDAGARRRYARLVVEIGRLQEELTEHGFGQYAELFSVRIDQLANEPYPHTDPCTADGFHEYMTEVTRAWLRLFPEEFTGKFTEEFTEGQADGHTEQSGDGGGDGSVKGVDDVG